MAKERIPVLTDTYFIYQRKLAEGYVSVQNRVLSMLKDPDPLTPYDPISWWEQEIGKKGYKKVILPDLPREEGTGKSKPVGEPTFSERWFTGQPTAVVVYPCGKRYTARVKVSKDLAVVEPTFPNTACWIVDRREMERGPVVDLRAVPAIRQVHCPSARTFFLSDFR